MNSMLGLPLWGFPAKFESMRKVRNWCFLLLLLPGCGLFGQAMPPGIPELKIDWYQDTVMCDYLFLSTERFVLPVTLSSTGLILDRRGAVVWYIRSDDNLYNFSLQPDGTITFNQNDTWFALDSTMNPVPVANCGASAGDFHDHIRLANGNTIALCNADTIMDLRGLYTYSGQEGDSAATVRYNLVEERNAAGQLLRSWRAIDHFSPADVDSIYFYYPWYLELNHTNSMDFDGQHLLLSHRSNHEVTLINWATGDVIWRLGGPNNDFYMLNDGGFNSQHDARFAGQDRISLFDNRTHGAVNAPRAVVYSIDTIHWVATKLYDRVAQNAESPTMGSFRELSNGDGLVCWGQVFPEAMPNVSYFHADGRKVCDWKFEDPHLAYRVMCGELPWTLERPEIYCTQQNSTLTLHIQGSHPSVLWSTGDTTQSIQVSDTGYYQAYVPLGGGHVGSNVIRVRNLNGACPSTPIVDPAISGRPPRLVATYDLMGRVVIDREPGHVYVERYDNGLSRKIVQY